MRGKGWLNRLQNGRSYNGVRLLFKVLSGTLFVPSPLASQFVSVILAWKSKIMCFLLDRVQFSSFGLQELDFSLPTFGRSL